MDTTTVFLVLVVLTVTSFFMGRKRSHAVVSGQGGARMLHSLPKHYGYMAALWALLPALLVLALWLAFESTMLARHCAQRTATRRAADARYRTGAVFQPDCELRPG